MRQCLPALLILLLAPFISLLAQAQVPPSAAEAKAYRGLAQAAWAGDVVRIRALLNAGAKLKARDSNGRTALHIAAFASHESAVETLVKRGSDVNALENDRYDIITIAAVANDLAMLKLALALGGNPANVTSRYDGTALIAAAHLGHHQVVAMLIDAGAPLDHVNNLQWTALLEAVILGDGGPRHQTVVAALVKAGASKKITDGQGRSALDHAKARRYDKMVALLR